MKILITCLSIIAYGLISNLVGWYIGYKDGLEDSSMQLNARVKDYPVCDYLNNALRFLCSNKNIYRYKNVQKAANELIYAMIEAGCVIYTDVVTKHTNVINGIDERGE